MVEGKISVLDQLDQLEEIVLEGTRVPFSGGRLINEQDAIEVMDAVREAVPGEFPQAVELIRQKDEFIAQARRQAEEIVVAARREREQLVHQSAIRQEAERQGTELRDQARQQGEQLLVQARQKAAKAEQELQTRLAQMEQQFASRRQNLEQEAAERNRLLLEQHERNRQQAMGELEQVRQEGLRIQRESQAEAERLQNDALQFRQQTQGQCEQLMTRTRQEAHRISEGANHYAEQVLSELESRLKDLGQVVIAGRRELGRLQVSDHQTSADLSANGLDSTPVSRPGKQAAAQQGGVPSSLSRRRRMANTLKQIAG